MSDQPGGPGVEAPQEGAAPGRRSTWVVVLGVAVALLVVCAGVAGFLLTRTTARSYASVYEFQDDAVASGLCAPLGWNHDDGMARYSTRYRPAAASGCIPAADSSMAFLLWETPDSMREALGKMRADDTRAASSGAEVGDVDILVGDRWIIFVGGRASSGVVEKLTDMTGVAPEPLLPAS